jgi:hypothetical protein
MLDKGGHDSHLIWTFNRDITPASRHRVDVAMPAIAWRMLEELLFDYCFDQRGFHRKEIKTTVTNTLKAVRGAMNVRENHPALTGTAAMGSISEWIPVWERLAPNRKQVWSPYPISYTRFTILAPTTISQRGHKLTKWVDSPDTVGRRWLLTEKEHLAFPQKPQD